MTGRAAGLTTVRVMTSGEIAHHNAPAPRPGPVRHGSGPADAGPAGGEPLLTREILTLAAAVVLGAIMTILDATIVNVALPTPAAAAVPGDRPRQDPAAGPRRGHELHPWHPCAPGGVT